MIKEENGTLEDSSEDMIKEENGTFEDSSEDLIKEEKGTFEDSSEEHGSFKKLASKLFDLEYTDRKAYMLVKKYYRRLNEEAEEYIKLLREIFGSSDVTWSVPWYQGLDCYLTRPPPKKAPDGEEMYLTGPMKKHETQIIKDNWEELVKKYHIPNRPDLLAKWKSKRVKIQSLEKTRVIIMACLARNTKRSIYQVYKEFCSIFGLKQKYSGYSPIEARVMSICFYHNYQKSVVLLQTILGREPRGLYVQRDLFNKNLTETTPTKREKVEWTLELAEKFVKSLVKRSRMPLKSLKGAKIRTSVWNKVERKMGISKDHLQKFWYRRLHMQLFVKKKILLHEVRRKVFEILEQSPEYNVWKDINWEEVSAYFPSGYTCQFLRHTAGHFLAHGKKKRINIFETPLREAVKIGKTYMPTRKTKLNRLIYDSEGKLRCRSEHSTEDDNHHNIENIEN